MRVMPKRRRKKSFYAVRHGRKTGIFTCWKECLASVNGFSNAAYRGFSTRQEAEAYLNHDGDKNIRKNGGAGGASGGIDKNIRKNGGAGDASGGNDTTNEARPLFALDYEGSQVDNVPVIEKRPMKYKKVHRAIGPGGTIRAVKIPVSEPEHPIVVDASNKNAEEEAHLKEPAVLHDEHCCDDDYIELGNNKRGKQRSQSSFDRFFACLLEFSASDYVQSEESPADAEALWESLCLHVQLERPTMCIPARCNTAQQHFALRAALVLEESRAAIAQSLVQRPEKPEVQLRLELTCFSQRKDGARILTFKRVQVNSRGKPIWFNTKERDQLMAGTVWECQTTDKAESVLGYVLPCDPERIIRQVEFDILIENNVALSKGSDWVLTPVDTLLTAARQFVACTENPEQVPFLDALMGKNEKKNGGTRVVAGSSLGSMHNSSPPTKGIFEGDTTNHLSSIFNLSQLNAKQEQAVTNFLGSKPKSITIVQGYVTCDCRFLNDAILLNRSQ